MDQGEEPGQPGNDASMGRVTTRRFPSPRSVRELEQAFRIEDANGQAVAYTYFRREENEARQANVLTGGCRSLMHEGRIGGPARPQPKLRQRRSPRQSKIYSVAKLSLQDACCCVGAAPGVSTSALRVLCRARANSVQ